jgi:3-methyladenine DNA glycosylase/8-oxoguanine DNA glycosylase
MAKLEITLDTPRWWQLRTVVFSHGWYDLPPFLWDDEKEILFAAAVVGDRAVDISILQPKQGSANLKAEFLGRSSTAMREQIQKIGSSMLGLSLSFDDFYKLVGPEYAWAKKRGAGPFLRGASVFEDAVKMLATTNCSWSLTRQMMTRLTDSIGLEAPSGRRAFPTPAAMAREPSSFYRDVVRAGYRSAFFPKFAQAVAEQSIDVESWCNYLGSSAELVKTIRSQPGFGPYAAENLCKLLGRFDGLGLDSWCMKKYPQIAGPVRGDVGKAIENRYARYKEWKGLALWLDLTRDWHEENPLTLSGDSFKKR